MTSEPWKEMMRIESSIFNKLEFFSRRQFVKRSDGYYCIKTPQSLKPSCMPETKMPETNSTKKIINTNSFNILTEIYANTSLSYNLETIYNRKFSWLDKYNVWIINLFSFRDLVHFQSLISLMSVDAHILSLWLSQSDPRLYKIIFRIWILRTIILSKSNSVSDISFSLLWYNYGKSF